MAEVKDLRHTAGETAYDRVRLLMEIENDAEFRSQFPEGKAQDSALNAPVDDLCATFAELKLMMQFKSRRSYWRNSNLRSLLKQAQEYEAEQARSGGKPLRKRKVITQEEHKKTEDTLTKSRLELQVQKHDFQKVETELEILKEENRELLRENAELKGRIIELERLVNHERAAVSI